MRVIPSRRFITRLLAFAVTAFSVVACRTYSENDLHVFDKKIAGYTAKKNWEMEVSESGLYKQVVSSGDTASRAIGYTSEITIAYKGKLLNGKTVDQSRPGKPLVAKLSGLIAGFQEGLFEEHKGAKIRLIIPPNLGYGDEKKGPIPANSVLVFEIEVLDVH